MIFDCAAAFMCAPSTPASHASSNNPPCGVLVCSDGQTRHAVASSAHLRERARHGFIVEIDSRVCAIGDCFNWARNPHRATVMTIDRHDAGGEPRSTMRRSMRLFAQPARSAVSRHDDR